MIRLSTRWFIGMLALSLVTHTLAYANPYVIDRAHSSVSFKVNHLELSAVQGQFKRYKSTVHWSESDPSKSSISTRIDVASIDTGIKKRDKHLRASDFLDADQYPHIRFKSTAITKQSDTQYTMNGHLTIKDQTHPVTIPISVVGTGVGPRGKERIGLSGQFSINRFDYGIEWKNKLKNGTLIVSDKVTILLTIQLVKQ